MRRALVALAVCAACGDSRTVEQRVDAVSGTRLKLELYLFEDGTRQVAPTAFYDERLHVECAPAKWIDGEQRCVPIVGEAVFADAACMTPIGFWPTKEKRPPTHFLGYEQVENEPDRVAAHLYPVSGKITSATEFYARTADSCSGPFSPPPDVATYGTNSELAPQSMQVVFDLVVGNGRIALRVRSTPDGLFAPWSVYDRELDTPCTPIARASGVACEPDADDVNAYADASCTVPAVVYTTDAPHASYARMADAVGCSRFAARGADITTAYAKVSSTCTPFAVTGSQGAWAVGAAVEPAPLSRVLEDIATQRLQHQIFESPDDADLRFVGDSLYDLATRSECVLFQDGDVKRCLPTPLPIAATLYGSGCAVPIKVALVSPQACTATPFARSFTDSGDTTIHAVGDVVIDPLYQFTGLGCTPYTPPPGLEPHSIGPAISTDHFAAAFLYGAR